MKKVVRMLGLCALVALAFTACKKDDTQKVTFTANVAQTTNDARTQAAYGAYLIWNDGDVIQIFNGAGDEMDFTGQGNTGLPGVAQFTADETEEIEFVKDLETAKYTAFYPNAEVNEDNQVTLAIPAAQTYVPNKSFTDELYPMVGWNMDGDGNYCDRFQFYSHAGFLVVYLQSLYEDQIQYVDELVLHTNYEGDALSGHFYYDKEGNLLTEVGENGFVGNGDEIVMTALDEDGNPVSIEYEQARDFTFVLPQGALFSGFSVEAKLNGEVLETYYAQPRPNNVIQAQNYTAMIAQPLPLPPAPTK